MKRLINRVLRWRDTHRVLWRVIAIAILVLSLIILVLHDVLSPTAKPVEPEPKRTISLPMT